MKSLSFSLGTKYSPQFNAGNSKGFALVFSGGGGKGAYEIGVWRALNEYGVTPNIRAISGTSVGALNAALFAQGNYLQAEYVWRTISPEAVITLNDLTSQLRRWSNSFASNTHSRLAKMETNIINWLNLLFSEQGILSKEGLSTIIDHSLDIQRMLEFPGPIYTASFNTSKMQLEYFDLKKARTPKQIKDRLLASASIPLAFGKTYIDGDLYWDGGISGIGDNTPIAPLYNEGYRNLIVVHLSREVPIDKNRFPDCTIIEIMPQDDMGGILSGTMNFTPEFAARNLENGYKDACRLLEPLYRTGAAQRRTETTIYRILKDQHDFNATNQILNQKIRQSFDSIEDSLSKLERRKDR